MVPADRLKDKRMTELTEQLWKVTPFNGAGYGFAIVIITYTAFLFYKKAKQERELNISYMDHVNSILTIIETRLQDQQEILSDNKSILHEIEKINSKLDAKNN